MNGSGDLGMRLVGSGRATQVGEAVDDFLPCSCDVPFLQPLQSASPPYPLGERNAPQDQGNGNQAGLECRDADRIGSLQRETVRTQRDRGVLKVGAVRVDRLARAAWIGRNDGIFRLWG